MNDIYGRDTTPVTITLPKWMIEYTIDMTGLQPNEVEKYCNGTWTYPYEPGTAMNCLEIYIAFENFLNGLKDE